MTDLAGPDLELELELYRRELTAYCYRMMGSAFEAEDAVQETMVRAWRNLDRFEGRSSLRSWLYRIATNVCLDQLKGRQRRARPMDLGPAKTVMPDMDLAVLPDSAWVEPIPDGMLFADGTDPAEQTVARESVRLAFVAALQHLPPRQRAVLILCEVLRWQAAEVADLLETTVASVNSALQRARATIAENEPKESDSFQPMDQTQQVLLAQFVDAFERYDLDLLTTLLHEDVVQSMPPFDLWIKHPDQIRLWWEGPGAACRGSKIIATSANGMPAYGQYRPSGPNGEHEPWALHVLETSGDKITGLHSFLDTPRLFPLCGLPPTPDG